MVEIPGSDYDIRDSSDKEFSYVIETGKWTDMIADLMDIADIAVRPLWITYPRRQALSYTVNLI